MKKIKYFLPLYLAIGCMLIGCNEFLDVNPSGTVTQDKMFEDVQGYRDAMYGIYAKIAREDLYGRNLSYGFADQLAQLFYNPYESTTETVGKTLQYAYRDQALLPLIENIWAKAYESISYINNVLENIQHVNLNSDPDYRLIKGEAYALRAFLHFDMMRYYCDNILQNPTAGGIPYAYTYDLQNKKLYSLKECYANVLHDLGEAQHLLTADTSLHIGQDASSYKTDRYSHVNLYAVYAIKARVFQHYGDLDSAGIYAEKIIQAPAFRLVEDPANLSKVKKYPAANELIWGLFNNKLYDPLYTLFLSDGRTTFRQVKPRNDIKTIYQDVSWNADNHDYRWENFFGTDQDGYIFTRLLKVNPEDPKDVENQKKATSGVCLFRLPEMYYIAAEALYRKDKTKALEYFNKVRKSRGLNTPMDDNRVNTWEKFSRELLYERRKEFWGEGQTFLDYKRTNSSFQDITSKKEIQASTAIFVLPWPRNEIEFGASNL